MRNPLGDTLDEAKLSDDREMENTVESMSGQLVPRLDPEQSAAVMSPPGPLAVVAGAGTGKTTTLVARVTHHVSNGTWDPSEVLVVTHSAKAAGHLRERLRVAGVEGVTARTFHAHALAIVSRHWTATGRDGRGPAIAQNQYSIVRSLLRRSRKKEPDKALVADIISEISWAKAMLIEPAEYAKEATRYNRVVSGGTPAEISRWYATYERDLQESGQVDFTDILTLATELCEDPALIGELLVRHLLVDEFQDTDPAQAAFLSSLLCGEDLTVVGDPRQAIFSFKGADRSLLERFRERDGVAVVELVRNYRSSPEIVERANRLASTDAPLTGMGPAGPEPELVVSATEEDEARYVAAVVKAELATGTSPSEIALLVRFNAQTAAFEQALTASSIPYRVLDADRFFDRPEIVGVLRDAWARAGDGSASVEVHPGTIRVGSVAVDAALAAAGFDPARPPSGSGAARDRWEAYSALAGLVATMQVRDDEREMLRELAERRREAHDVTTNTVTIATIHKAKGLEWDVVIVPRLVEGSLPSAYATMASEREEELRLMYVACTRPRRRLVITRSDKRVSADGSKRWPAVRSHFLDLIGLWETSTATYGSNASTGRTGAGRTGTRPTGSSSKSSLSIPKCRSCGTVLNCAASMTYGVCAKHLTGEDAVLYARLVAWRKKTADRTSAPVFTILTDEALLAVVLARPAKNTALAMCPGVGSGKAGRYGAEIVALLKG